MDVDVFLNIDIIIIKKIEEKIKIIDKHVNVFKVY